MKKSALLTTVLTTLLLMSFSQSSMAMQGMSVVNSGTDFNTGYFHEETIDLQVKTAKGLIKHRRYVNGGTWHINPQWSDLTIEYKANDASTIAKIFRDGRFEYEKVGGVSSNIYSFKNLKTIEKTTNGFRWSDRQGNWIDYDNQGKILAYGDQNATIASFKKDAQGRIEHIHNGSLSDPVILTYTYEGDVLKTATDASGRSISYDYNAAQQIIRFTDVLGEDWDYAYSEASPTSADALYEYKKGDLKDNYNNYMLIQRKGPKDQYINMKYGKQSAISICAGGYNGGQFWSFDSGNNDWAFTGFNTKNCTHTVQRSGSGPIITLEYIKNSVERLSTNRSYYDITKNQWIQSTSYADGSMTSITLNEDGEVVQKINNGRTTQSTHIQGNVYTTADENRNITVVRKDARKNPLHITFADGSQVTRTYHPDFNLPTSVTNEKGIITTYQYDAKANLKILTQAKGTDEQIITTFDYNDLGLLTDVSRDGRTQQWRYDTNGNLHTYTDGENQTTTFENYDDLGNPWTIIDARGKTTTFVYDAVGNLKQMTSPLNFVTTYQHDELGNLTNIIDPNQHTTTLAYDERNRVTHITNALNQTQEIKYTARNYIKQLIDASNKSIRFDYDLDGNITKVTDGNNNVIDYDLGFNNLKPYKNLVNQVTYPSGYSTLFEYDKRNRPTSSTDIADGEDERKSIYRYDAVGNVTQFTDPKGLVSSAIYDAHNRLKEHHDPDAAVTLYDYDKHGNLEQVTNARNNAIREYQYNQRNQLVKEVLPVVDGSSAAFETQYDAVGNVEQQIDAKGQVHTYTYDDDNRLTHSRTFSNITQSTDNSLAQKTTVYAYDPVGNLTSYTDGISSGTYTYDDANRLLTTTINYGAFSKTSAYTYYANGNKKTFTGPNGITISYGYDANNQLQTVSIPDQGTMVVNENNWLAPKTVTFPGGAGVQQTTEFDGYLRPKNIETSKQAGSLSSVAYHYDPNDNITSRNVLTGSVTGDNTYSYDNLNRLLQQQANGTTTVALTYDEVGNRTTNSNDADPSTWQYDSRDRLTQRGKLSYSYDANGSVTSITNSGTVVRSFVYNLDNRLTQVKDAANQTIASYQYDPFGQRIAKTVAGTTQYFYYADEGLVAELTSNGEVTTAYGYWPNSAWGTNPLFIQQNGKTGYYQNDHLGTPQQVVDANGAVLWNASYSAFGEASITQSSITNNLRFPGQYFDSETQLHYNYFRYYDPQMGRYVTSDPIGLNGGINAYGYVGGNPVRFIDPLGLVCIPSGIASMVGAAVTGGIVGAGIALSGAVAVGTAVTAASILSSALTAAAGAAAVTGAGRFIYEVTKNAQVAAITAVLARGRISGLGRAQGQMASEAIKESGATISDAEISLAVNSVVNTAVAIVGAITAGATSILPAAPVAGVAGALTTSFINSISTCNEEYPEGGICE